VRLFSAAPQLAGINDAPFFSGAGHSFTIDAPFFLRR
jgi:hypothetical protein